MSLSKENKYPEIRFKGFTEAWEQRKLGDLMSFSNGINAPKENYGSGTKMISVMDILTTELVSYNNIQNSVSVTEQVEEKNKVEQGDIVFVRSSEVVEEVGWAKAYLDDKYALYSGFTIRGKKEVAFNSFFVEHSLNNTSRRQIERKAGGSTRFNVSQGILNTLLVKLPSYEEQNQIGTLFKKLDDTIALHQCKLNRLENLKKAYLQVLFPSKEENTPKMRFTNFNESWEQRKLSSISEETYGGGTPKTKVKEYWQGDFPWIQSSDLKQDELSNVIPKKFISKEAILNSATKIIPEKSIAIVTRVGVGKLAFIPYPFSTSQDFLSLSNLRIDSQFGVYSIYRMLQKELSNIQGTSIKGITKSDLLNKKIHIPNKLNEQKKIGDFFKSLDNTIALHQEKLDKLFILKNAYLKMMFI